jgi:leucyl aminopeptidase
MFENESNLKIRGAEIRREDAYLFIPLFKTEGPYRLPELFKKKGLADTIQELTEAGIFRASALEILPVAKERVILGGLGSAESFHPDRLSALFRELGHRISSLESLCVNIAITAELREVVERFDAISRGEQKPVKPKESAFTITESPDEMEIAPDYFTEYTMEEAVSQAIASMLIGSVSLDTLKSKREPRKEILVGFNAGGLETVLIERAVERGRTLAEFVNRTRTVAMLPGNHFNPDQFESYAKKLARTHKLNIKIMNAAKLKSLGCGGILSVGKGSKIPPRMLIVEYKPLKPMLKGRLVLVGKGITFDSGGISLKPALEMHEMKYDMTGAATALHALALAKARNLPIEVVALLGIAENMPGPESVKPGDVYTAYNGLTVEVQNTDAEGRLLLGDLLAYACKNYRPRYMIDMATLTGACVVALGNEAAALLTRSDDLARRLESASRRSLDRLWRMPHWFQFGMGLRSDISDLRNIAGREAGTISAMRFLSAFVDDGIEWAHLDIAGVAWRKRAGGPHTAGSTGWGIRMLNQFMEDLIEKG